MPIVAEIPSLWPADLFDHGFPCGRVIDQGVKRDCCGQWVAVKVESRCEKAVAREVSLRGWGYFLGLRRQIRYYQRRRVVVQTPIFPGYLFVLLSPEEQSTATLRKIKHVLYLLQPPDPLQLWKELHALYRVLESNCSITPEEQLQPGERARIIKGCLKGVEGIIIANREGWRLLVVIKMLGQGVSLEISVDQVERIT